MFVKIYCVYATLALDQGRNLSSLICWAKLFTDFKESSIARDEGLF